MTSEQIKLALKQIAKTDGLTNWAQDMTNKVALELANRFPGVDPKLIGKVAKHFVKETIAEIAYNH
jgi:hypothetical protein